MSEIKLKHDPKKCWQCRHQAKINKYCKEYPFGIEFEATKERGYFSIRTTFTIHFGNERIPIMPPFFVKDYKLNSPIDMCPMPPVWAIKKMIKEAQELIKKLPKNKA